MKKLLLFILTAALVFSFSACGINDKIQNRDFLDENTDENAEPAEKSAVAGGVLWSFEIPENGDVSEILAQYKDAGLDYIDFRILWSSFEVEKGKYNWTFFDKIMKQITDAGYFAGVSLVLWTNGLSFKDELELQKTADGEIYVYDESRGEFPSLTSENNKKIIFSAIEALADRIAEKYSDKTVVCQVLTSPFGDAGYSAEEDLDYSDSAAEAFYAFIAEKYQSPEKFSEIYALNVETFDDLKNIGLEKLAETCVYDRKLFKQKTLAEFQKEACKIFKAADSSVLFKLSFGGIGDTKAAVYRGFFDPYEAEKTVGADIISAEPENGGSVLFTSDYIGSTAMQSFELSVYERDLSEEKKSDILSAAKNGKLDGICFDITENAENTEFIKEAVSAVKGAKKPELSDKGVIFVNTADFVLRSPAKSLYAAFAEKYSEISENGTKTVRFITDTMLTDGKAGEITELLSSVSGKYFYLTEEAAKTLKEKQIYLKTEKAGTFELRNEYKTAFSEEDNSEISVLFK